MSVALFRFRGLTSFAPCQSRRVCTGYVLLLLLLGFGVEAKKARIVGGRLVVSDAAMQAVRLVR